MKISTAVALLVSVCLLFAAAPAAVGGDHPPAEKIRALVITGGHGFEEKPFAALFDSIADVQTTRATYPAAAEMLAPSLAKDFDVVVFYDMTKGLSAAQHQAFIDLLQSGIGVLALHHTLVAHADWPEYAKIIGGKYYMQEQTVDGKTVGPSSFRHDQDIQIRIAEADHPITRGLAPFEIHDETYFNFTVDPSVQVLLTTDHPQSNREIAWVKTYGNSRVCYVQLGHGRRAYENPHYRQLVARGIRWAAGRPADPAAAPTELFNGKDLTGWRPEGNARWEVKDGLLVGRQGPNEAAGDLLTEATFDDFELTVTFKVVWPANSGVWYRYQSPQKAYQADILEFKKPVAYSGTLYCPGKMFLAINDDPTLVHHEGWNELRIRAVGNRHVISLNGTKVADVRDDGSRRGSIGLQVHPGAQFANMRILVKAFRIRSI